MQPFFGMFGYGGPVSSMHLARYGHEKHCIGFLLEQI